MLHHLMTGFMVCLDEHHATVSMVIHFQTLQTVFKEPQGLHTKTGIMNFFSILLALLIEQFKPLRGRNPIHEVLIRWIASIGKYLDAGQPIHAWLV